MGTRLSDTEAATPASSKHALTLVKADADHRVALFGALLVSVWIRETRVEALQGMEAALKASAPSVPGGRLGLFVIVEQGATPPSSAARDELARIRRTNPIALTALVYEGSGFQAALVRAITMSLNVLEKAETRIQVFADVQGAAHWVETRASHYGGASDLVAAVRSLRTLADAV